MARFTDREGRDWVLRIDVWGIKQVRERTGFDISGLPQRAEALTDPVLFSQVLWILCEDQAKAKGIDEKAFLQGLDGDSLDAADPAFEEAFLDFCPSRLRSLLKDAQAAKTSSESATSSPESLASVQSG